MTDLQVHLYAICWNEAPMLPFFFRHYDPVVDRFFIFDNGSTDGSLEILANHPKVTLRHLTVKGDSFVLAARNLYNECWKASRGHADFVIICNIDEHLYHTDLRSYLDECRRNQFTLIVPHGYQMVSEDFPSGAQPLCQQIRRGARARRWDKPEIFSPGSILEINFSPGRHEAMPEGNVRSPANAEVKLLHYKFLGLDYFSARLAELREGLRDGDIRQNLGGQYLWDREKKAAEFRRLLASAVEILPE